MANRESRSSWKDFLIGLRKRGLNGVEFVVADDHSGLRSANPPFSLRYATRSHACAVASAS